MKTFTEFKKHLQETKAGKEYKATDLDKQINQALEDAKNNSDNQEIVKLEAIRDEKDDEKKKARFDIYMNKKEEDSSQDDAQDDPDADSVQEANENDSSDPDVKKVKDCEQMTPRQKKIKMERLRDRK